MNTELILVVGARAWQQTGRPDPEIFDPEKNLILNPEPGPDFNFSPETDTDPELFLIKM